MINRFANPKYAQGVSRGDFSESKIDNNDKSNIDKGISDLDIHTKNLNKLTRKTPEGYMIIIEQRQFEGRENVNSGIGGGNQNNTTMINQSKIGGSENTTAFAQAGGRNGLSKDVEKIFSRICQSIELYKTDNIPIITEFLEF